MQLSRQVFTLGQSMRRPFTWGDTVVVIVITLSIYAALRLAFTVPTEIEGPTISLSRKALPWYAALSIGRMAAAYALSMVFTIIYGYMAAYNRRAEMVLIPLLDVLQSIPILSFLPAVLLSFSAVLPQKMAAELASIVLIFTSQAWNMIFAWYRSLTIIPRELREASTLFRFNGWLRFKTLELPFAALSLIWNSMLSWSGGWFFLMAAEIFSVGERDFRLAGLGTYLQEAAIRGDVRSILWGVATLVFIIVVLDQLVWRPLLAWGDHFKLEMVESDNPPTSWFYDELRSSRMLDWLARKLWQPLSERLDQRLLSLFPVQSETHKKKLSHPAIWYLLGVLLGGGILYGVIRTGQMLWDVRLLQWLQIGVGLGATLLRVLAALIIALAWTIPLGVLIGTNQRMANWLQPLVQIAASIPATALFPILVLMLIALPGGLNMAAILLMLMGTQWYLLFNIIAGASSIPQDLKYTSSLLQLKRWKRWRTLILPALFPYIVTGSITASGGAWNASIVAEYVKFGGETFHTTGIGALIAHATAAADYPLLLAATLSMVLTVVVINRAVWRRLYNIAEEQYRME